MKTAIFIALLSHPAGEKLPKNFGGDTPKIVAIRNEQSWSDTGGNG